MVEQVREAIERLRSLVAALDPGALDGRQARQLVELFADGERLSGAGKALAAGRVEQTSSWVRGGFRSAAHFVAAVSGTSVVQAAATIETAQALEALPATEEALRAGKLSTAQVNEVAAAARIDPGAEASLLRSAPVDGLKGIRDKCARVKAAASDDVNQYDRIHRGRAVRHYRVSAGAGCIDIRGPLDATTRVMAALEPYEKELFTAARDDKERERPEAIAFDALLALADATRPGAGEARGPKSTVVFRIDHAAFVRGKTEPGEVCEIPGVGPVPVEVVRMAADDAVLKAIVTNGVDVLAVSHLGRTIPAHLRTALDELYPECAVAGCHVNRHLDIDHNQPVEEHGPTALWNLNKLCRWHHKHKTRHMLRLVGTGTDKRFAPSGRGPPDDPDPPVPENDLSDLALAV